MTEPKEVGTPEKDDPELDPDVRSDPVPEEAKPDLEDDAPQVDPAS